ncbi:MAG: hypothetical protein LUE17_09280 [Planctomycetaceae bacterium]|nr:hypothetical protein [Planctomycetaceae bacterium]
MMPLLFSICPVVTVVRRRPVVKDVRRQAATACSRHRRVCRLAVCRPVAAA